MTRDGTTPSALALLRLERGEHLGDALAKPQRRRCAARTREPMHGLVLDEVSRGIAPLTGEPNHAPPASSGEKSVDLHLTRGGPKLKRREIPRLLEHDDRERRQRKV